MQPPPSPRLPGVPILTSSASGPEYSRWRRGVRFVLETKGTWKYCNGELPMPMPKTRRSSSASTKKTKDIQPSLLEERRAWVRQDREVKLDIFLSLAEEVMQDVFEVGPPLPPTNLTAQQLLDALDARFAVFSFASYHHAFCHFLNLHIDQYTSMADFNNEFKTVLEDLLDYGHPLSNAQACSAYFSKLRCTQNPWVARKLDEWQQMDKLDIYELMQESPPWSCVRPLATKASQTFPHELQQRRIGVREEQQQAAYFDNSSSSSFYSDDVVPGLSSSDSTISSSKASSSSSHSRQLSNNTARSQEITVYAPRCAGLEVDPYALHAALEKLTTVTPSPPPPALPLPTTSLPELLPQSTYIPPRPQAAAATTAKSSPHSGTATPAWLAPLDRPLPPLPPQTPGEEALPSPPPPPPLHPSRRPRTADPQKHSSSTPLHLRPHIPLHILRHTQQQQQQQQQQHHNHQPPQPP
ncbi:hypothetical protein GMOD_00007915 [Pyrenophora seminiperda CCB06]|uniref:Uncharacterized protein n=1 Tax=Pyrenophora seminiperda CCB06 TaxID=1302712 RepID=A0A3M7MG03_9PLEO|nr:hypothetical protein GMOD_00007915 [Pyrenophora seminiperda CCB06]